MTASRIRSRREVSAAVRSMSSTAQGSARVSAWRQHHVTTGTLTVRPAAADYPHRSFRPCGGFGAPWVPREITWMAASVRNPSTGLLDPLAALQLAVRVLLTFP